MPRLLALLRELVPFSSAGVAPPQTPGLRHASQESKARRASPPARGDRTHTYGDAQPAETASRARGSLLSHPAPPCLTSCAQPQCAPGCVAHKHTHSGPCSWRARRHRSYRTAHARLAPAQRRHGGGGSRATPPAHSLTTAWRTLRRTLPARDARTPTPAPPAPCAACTPGPSPLYPLASLPTHGSKHAVQGRLATPQTPPSIIHPCVPVRTGTSLSIPPVTTCRTSVAGAYIGRQESCR